MLRKLAELYKVGYEALLTAAGYAPEAAPVTRDLFLSHSSKDKSVVRELAGAIESELYRGQQLTLLALISCLLQAAKPAARIAEKYSMEGSLTRVLN